MRLLLIARSLRNAPFGVFPGRYAIWAKMVGVRPGFWHPDRVIRENLGEVDCAGDIIGTG